MGEDKMGEEKGLISINYNDPKMIKTLQATVAKDATPDEFQMFVKFCEATGLNPFKKEIWFIKAGGRVQMMTGINGFLAIANSHPMFDGMEIQTIEENGRPVKAIAKVYRKDRKFPSVGIALLREFGKDTPVWKSMPTVMLTKVAKSIAIREAFAQELNGLYTEEEMPKEYAASAVVVNSASIQPKPTAQDAQGEAIEAEAIQSPRYVYDLAMVCQDVPDAADQKKLFASIKQKFNAKKEGSYCVSPSPIDGWGGYLVEGPAEEKKEEMPVWAEVVK
jgi:phage recombination protein Bet